MAQLAQVASPKSNFLSLLVAVVAVSTNTKVVTAFTSPTVPTASINTVTARSYQGRRHGYSLTRMYGTSSDGGGDDKEDATDAMLQDLESARASFEKLVVPKVIKDATSNPTSSGESSYVPSPLTENSKRRREVEIELLQSLIDSDEGVDELMSLWMTERDFESTMELQSMETICSPGLVEEENLLLGMIQNPKYTESGIDDDWAEPMVRLATLYYYQGQTELAYYWCSRALEIKPWHFEAGHTLVLLALRQQNLDMACHYRRKICLPPLNPRKDNKKRKEWVSRAITNANDMIQRAERAHDDMLVSNSQEEETWQ